MFDYTLLMISLQVTLQAPTTTLSGNYSSVFVNCEMVGAANLIFYKQTGLVPFGSFNTWGPIWTRLVWSGLIWSGLVWSGLVWSGLVWSGLVWSGLVWSV